MTPGTLAFWTALALVVYTYLGYPAALWILGWRRARSLPRDAITPTVTVVIAARNEGPRIGAKVDDILNQDYPEDRLDLVVVSDGSSDATVDAAAARGARSPGRVRMVALPERGGKAAALNVGVAAARGEIVVFADARQRLPASAISHLVRSFADPEVGAVSGELVLLDPERPTQGEGLGLYWRYEKSVRRWESRLGACIGYTGALCAVRRELFVPLPREAILDDLLLPLQLLGRGYRVVFEPEARAYDRLSADRGHEFRRKVRTLVGVLQTFVDFRARLGPLPLRVWWQCVSHKLLRLAVPYALLVILVTSFLLPGRFYRAALAVQLAAYACGVLGWTVRLSGPLQRLLSAAAAVLLLNAAAACALWSYLAGRRLDLWRHPAAEGATR
jgi:poly-beta-1,6-N-acetyl-D-glucosamine synthase